MKGAARISEVATTALFVYPTSALITGLITISILGALNVVTMLGPRIYYVFFQAEDCIRDWSVTGVQTCALPISLELTGERTLPDVPAENYWFRRHLAVYE